MDKPKDAFLALYKPIERQLSGYCLALAGSAYEAADLLHDAILIGLENFGFMRKPESFMFYMCAIAKRTYLKQLRRKKFEAGMDEITQAISDGSNAGEINADVQMLYRMISKLPLEQREALVMFEIMGFSLKEIQKFQGDSLSAVKSRVTRAREKLTEMLADQETDVYVKPSRKLNHER